MLRLSKLQTVNKPSTSHSKVDELIQFRKFQYQPKQCQTSRFTFMDLTVAIKHCPLHIYQVKDSGYLGNTLYVVAMYH